MNLPAHLPNSSPWRDGMMTVFVRWSANEGNEACKIPRLHYASFQCIVAYAGTTCCRNGLQKR